MLAVGDLVLVKREPSVRREGAKRFQERVHPDIFRIVSGSHPSFRIASVGNPNKKLPVINPVSADNLVKLDMPELELAPDQPRMFEVLPEEADPVSGWIQYRLERYAVDGTVRASRIDRPERKEWLDLSKCRYRWIR